jgi:hypothetical protein
MTQWADDVRQYIWMPPVCRQNLDHARRVVRLYNGHRPHCGHQLRPPGARTIPASVNNRRIAHDQSRES